MLPIVPYACTFLDKSIASSARAFSREVLKKVKKSSNMHDIIYSLCRLCRVLLKRNELTEETEGLLHQLVTKCISENNLNQKNVNNSVVALHRFYLKLQSSFRMGKKSILVQENIELCHKKFPELESCINGSVSYVKGSQKIKPYFKGNAELHI